MLIAPLPYLDPGSQSILWQLAIAAILGLGVVIRASWSKIKAVFGIKAKTEDEDNADDAES